MQKKLITVNVSLILVLFASSVLSVYAVNFPFQQRFQNALGFAKLHYTLYTIIAICSVSLLLAFPKIKDFSFKSKYLIIVLILNLIFLTVIIINSVPQYLLKYAEYSQFKKEYLKKAEVDIRNDKITIEYFGGLEYNLDYSKEKDSMENLIYKKYGIQYQNTGCMYLSSQAKAQNEYNKIVNTYLEKRNGKNWEEKMRAEIKLIYK